MKGDLVINHNDGMIKTRSRAKQSMSLDQSDLNNSGTLQRMYQEYVHDHTTNINTNSDPDQFTIVSAPLKIVKLLVDELFSASGARAAHDAASAAVASADFDDSDDEEGWEDDDDALDLGLGATKGDLMSYIEGPGRRQPDDETQSFLTEFFMQCSRENVASFQQLYSMLSTEEQMKLNSLATNPGQ